MRMLGYRVCVVWDSMRMIWYGVGVCRVNVSAARHPLIITVGNYRAVLCLSAVEGELCPARDSVIVYRLPACLVRQNI